MRIEREWWLIGGAAALLYAMSQNKPSAAPSTPPSNGRSPTSVVAPTAVTALAAPSVGGSPYFPSIGGFAGAAVGATYGGLGGVNEGQGYGLFPPPNIYGWRGAYKAV